jgi:hypothetical protein
MNASNEKARRANAGPNFHTFSGTKNSTKAGEIEPAASRCFAPRIRQRGGRALFTFLARANLAECFPLCLAIDQAILAALGGVALLSAAHLIGRAFE